MYYVASNESAVDTLESWFIDHKQNSGGQWYGTVSYRGSVRELVPASSEIGHGLLSYNTINGLIRVYTRRHSQMREFETRSCRIDNYREFSPAGLTNRNSRQPQTFHTPLMYHQHTYAISRVRGCALNTYIHSNTTRPLLIYPRGIFNNSLTTAREMSAPLCIRQPNLILGVSKLLLTFFSRWMRKINRNCTIRPILVHKSCINWHKTYRSYILHKCNLLALL